jgi:2',3'-cyclic-nucleotide 2'-phosphodiesterase (5'-nucleotidase family)
MYPEPSYPMVALMNHTGFNLSCLGNHDFDGKIDALRNVINRSNFRYLCANVYAHDSLRLHVEPYKIFEIDGVRIGVLGLIHRTENGFPETHPNNVKGLTFRPPMEVAMEYGWLRDRCDIFILLVHQLYNETVDMAMQYPFADVIIGSHTHRKIDSTELHNNVLVTEAENNLNYVAHITLQLTDGKITKKEAHLMNVNNFSKKDVTVQKMVDEFNNDEALNQVVAEAAADISNYEEMGSMMADAIRVETGADIALENPGGVRLATIPKGPITLGTIYKFDPFNNEVIEYNLTGDELLKLIIASYYIDKNRAPYVSGITYEMHLDDQAKVIKLDVKMENGAPLNLKSTYKVVLNSYLAMVAKFEKNDPGRTAPNTAAFYTIQYLEKQKKIDYQGVKRVKVIIND